jgi:hypothetical protein
VREIEPMGRQAVGVRAMLFQSCASHHADGVVGAIGSCAVGQTDQQQPTPG